jgi:hypothetical protein
VHLVNLPQRHIYNGSQATTGGFHVLPQLGAVFLRSRRNQLDVALPINYKVHPAGFVRSNSVRNAGNQLQAP